MTNTTTSRYPSTTQPTTVTVLTSAARHAHARSEGSHRGTSYATLTVRLPDGSLGVVAARDVLSDSGRQDVPVQQGSRVDLWWCSQLVLVSKAV